MLLWLAFWLHMLGLGLGRLWRLALARRLRLAALPAAALIFYPTFYGAWCAGARAVLGGAGKCGGLVG